MPPSSDTVCRHDRDCLQGEVCNAWAGGDSGRCRRRCGSDLACASDEVCDYILHDGLPANGGANAVLGCVPEAPSPLCPNAGCRNFVPTGSLESHFARTWCSSSKVRGCFLTVDPQCGLGCHDVLIEDCGPIACTESGGAPRCAQPSNGSPCLQFSCGVCEPSAAPTCTNGASVMCGEMPMNADACAAPPCTCDRLCTQVVRGACAAQN